MRSYRTPQFRERYAALPLDIQPKADEAYAHFRQNPAYPGLQFKKIEDGNPEVWSVRVDRNYRALGLRRQGQDAISWVWIGTHREYEERI